MEIGLLKEGVFRKRLNKFLGVVEVDGREEHCFIPNPGRLEELLTDGTRVFLKEISARKRKTNYDLFAVESEGTFVSIDSRLPPKLFAEAVSKKTLREFKGCEVKGFEPVFGDVRFDVELECSVQCFVETKSCTLVKNGVAFFPDAPTKRGAKHLEMLIKARKRGFRSVLAVIIQRNDAVLFKPNQETDYQFSKALKTAVESGVEVYAYLTEFRKNSMFICSQVEVVI